MEVVKSKISSKGQIVIPKKFRETLKSDYIELVKEGDKLFIREAKPLENLAGCFSDYAKNYSLEQEKEMGKEAWKNHAISKYSAD